MLSYKQDKNTDPQSVNQMISVAGESDYTLTQLLARWQQGEVVAMHQLIDKAYGQLSQIAHRLMLRENRHHTLQTKALVHEGYLRLIQLKDLQWQNRAHFFSVWLGIMRRILIDHARGREAEKRGGQAVQISLSDHIPAQESLNLLDLDYALKKLAIYDLSLSHVVELRYFIGFSIEEAAAVLSISPATVKRKWTLAQAWLSRELKPQAC